MTGLKKRMIIQEPLVSFDGSRSHGRNIHRTGEPV